MEEIIKIILIDIILIAFMISILGSFGIEFNEYPYEKGVVYGNNNLTLLNVLICPKWNDNQLEYIIMDYNSDNKTDCVDYSLNKWEASQSNRITFYLNTEIIITDINPYTNELKLEVVDKNRAFLLINGKSVL